MDVFNIGQNNNQILSDLSKKIKIKHFKEKNKNKTCVYGMLDFISETDGKLLIKLIKKRLGCSGIMTEETPVKGKKVKTGKILIFSGNHAEEIKNIILEKKIADNTHIHI